MAAGGTDRNPIEVLSEEFLERIRRGEAVTPEDYALEHPELAEEILALFPALLMMEELGGETSDRTSSKGGEAGTIVGATAGRLGEFRLLREVGRGGMGVVYEAEQESLGRRVALKVLPTGALTDTKQVRRFEREARSAARLHHTNIVPIFGVGEHEGTHYYVMQFIQGQGLDAVLAELRKLRDLRTTRPSRASTPGPTEGGRVAADIARSLVTGGFAPGEAAASRPHRRERRRHGSLDELRDADSEFRRLIPTRAPRGGAAPRACRRWPRRTGDSRRGWRGSGSRWPRRSPMPTVRASSTATSSRRTCYWTARATSG